jgi:hypothetical protein
MVDSIQNFIIYFRLFFYFYFNQEEDEEEERRRRHEEKKEKRRKEKEEKSVKTKLNCQTFFNFIFLYRCRQEEVCSLSSF